MATVRAGQQPVLLVVDVQNRVMEGAWDAPRVIQNVALAVQRARTQAVPVVWVQHASEELPEGSAAWQWVPELAPQAGEPVVGKRFNSAFEDSLLDAELAKLGATHIALAGAETNWCIRATAYGAIERGYDLTLIEDAHTANPLELANGARIEPAQVIDDLNTAITWLRYPGRSNGTASAQQIDFGTPGGGRAP